MVKDEEDNLPLTLGTLTTLDGIIMLDTGSKDSTISITRDWCLKHNLDLRLKEEKFVDFSTSRNVLLKFADETMGDETVYLLLLDSSDQLMNPELLRNKCSQYSECTGVNSFYITQQLFMKSISSFQNIKLIKSHSNIKYVGSVHECLHGGGKPVLFRDVVLYQDRRREVGRSSKRYPRDLDILLDEHKKYPKNTRTVFYLAQTYQCLGKLAEAFDYYIMRSKMGGFTEEVYESLYRAACVIKILEPDNWNTALELYVKANNMFPGGRAEPLTNIAIYYRKKEMYATSFDYIKKACDAPYPKDTLLFVEDSYYNYIRWHEMGIVAFFSNSFDWRERGLDAINTAMCDGSDLSISNRNIDNTNKSFYM
jgi:hypothetical protein